jgi:two-component system chemotaxis response regulator CheB
MEPEPRNVLLVDDDASLIKVLRKYLESQDGDFTLLTATNGKQALELISQQDIPLVVSDINMPVMSGLELLAEIRELYPRTGVILMTAYSHREAIRTGAEQSGCLEFIEKPFDFEHLFNSINHHLGRRSDGFAGTLKNIQLTDLIQMCCLSMVDMAIRVRKGSDSGVIHIHSGNIVHAECREHSGEAAFYEILGWKSGGFETFSAPLPDQYSIDSNWQYLLMEGCRRADEGDDTCEIPAATPQPVEAPNEADAQPPEESAPRSRVLIVDDSAMMSRVLTDVVSSADELEVVGAARNGEEALEMIDTLRPDLITLDVNMPVMSGSTALKHIMIRNPCPVVIISSLGRDAGATIIDFLKLGAVDFIGKPSRSGDMDRQRRQMVDSLRQSVRARPQNFQRVTVPKPQPPAPQRPRPASACKHLVLVNSGKGGYAELIRLIPALGAMPERCLVALQSMPQELAAPLAEYLQSRSRSQVALLPDRAPLLGGTCYIGSQATAVSLADSGGPSMLVAAPADSKGDGRPVFDDLLASVADSFTGELMVLLLSGANVADRNLLAHARDRGGRVIAQQLNTCLLPDPLKPLVDQGLVEAEVAPKAIPNWLDAACNRNP